MDQKLALSIVLAACFAGTLGQDREAIAQGECRYRSFFYGSYCRIPGTTPDQSLEVTVLAETGRGACREGENYGLASDNSYIWVRYPCSALFLIERVNASATPVPVTLAPTTPAPATPVPTTKAPTTTTLGPLLPTWGPWGAWGPCTVSCGSGLQSRGRECSTGDERDCSTIFSYAVDTQTCSPGPCPATTTLAPSTPANNVTTSLGNCGLSNPFRIVGGTQAGACQYPWMVMVYDSVAGSVCGGSILDSTTILTAAHCLYREDRFMRETLVAPGDVRVYSGSSTMPFSTPNVEGLRRNAVTRVTPHPSYNSDTLVNDIALVKLSAPLPDDDCHRPLCLPDASIAPQDATACITMGWGVDSNRASASVQSQLKWASVPVADQGSCRNVYGSLATDKTFCAGGEGEDACSGDSGGPLTCRTVDAQGVARYVQQGVVSAGIDGRCGSLLGLYTNVNSYLTWIEQNRT